MAQTSFPGNFDGTGQVTLPSSATFILDGADPFTRKRQTASLGQHAELLGEGLAACSKHIRWRDDDRVVPAAQFVPQRDLPEQQPVLTLRDQDE